MAALILYFEDLTQEGQQTPTTQLTKEHIDLTKEGMYGALKLAHTVLHFRAKEFVVFAMPNLDSVVGPYPATDMHKYIVVSY